MVYGIRLCDCNQQSVHVETKRHVELMLALAIIYNAYDIYSPELSQGFHSMTHRTNLGNFSDTVESL